MDAADFSVCPFSLVSEIKNVLESVSITKVEENQELVVLIGPTGAGKTTAILFMMGNEMVKKQVSTNTEGGKKRRFGKGGKMVVDSKNKIDNLVVGHDTTKSETARSVLIDGSVVKENLVFCDTRGLSDSNGVIVDIANLIGLKTLLASVKSVKPILVISKEVFAVKSQAMKKLAKLFSRLFSSNVWRNSLLVYVTQESKEYFSEQFEQLLGFFEEQNKKETEKESEANFEANQVTQLLDCMAEIWEDRVFALDPLQDNPNDYIREISTMQQIANPAENIRCALSEEGIRVLDTLSKEFNFKVTKWIKNSDYTNLNKYYGVLVELCNYIPESTCSLLQVLQTLTQAIVDYCLKLLRKSDSELKREFKYIITEESNSIKVLKKREHNLLCLHEIKLKYLTEQDEVETISQFHNWLRNFSLDQLAEANVDLRDDNDLCISKVSVVELGLLFTNLAALHSQFPSSKIESKVINPAYSKIVAAIKPYMTQGVGEDWNNKLDTILAVVEFVEQADISKVLQFNSDDICFTQISQNIAKGLRQRCEEIVIQLRNLLVSGDFWTAIEENMPEAKQQLASIMQKRNLLIGNTKLIALCGEEQVEKALLVITEEFSKFMSQKVEHISNLIRSRISNETVNLNDFKSQLLQVARVRQIIPTVLNASSTSIFSSTIELLSGKIAKLKTSVINYFSYKKHQKECLLQNAILAYKHLETLHWLDEVSQGACGVASALSTISLTFKTAINDSFTKCNSLLIQKDYKNSPTNVATYLYLYSFYEGIGSDSCSNLSHLPARTQFLNQLETVNNECLVNTASGTLETLKEIDVHINILFSIKEIAAEYSQLQDQKLEAEKLITTLKSSIVNQYDFNAAICQDCESTIEQKSNSLNLLKEKYDSFSSIGVASPYTSCVSSIKLLINEKKQAVRKKVQLGKFEEAFASLSEIRKYTALKRHVPSINKLVMDLNVIITQKAELEKNILQAWEDGNLNNLSQLLLSSSSSSATTTLATLIQEYLSGVQASLEVFEFIATDETTSKPTINNAEVAPHQNVCKMIKFVAGLENISGVFTAVSIASHKQEIFSKLKQIKQKEMQLIRELLKNFKIGEANKRFGLLKQVLHLCKPLRSFTGTLEEEVEAAKRNFKQTVLDLVERKAYYSVEVVYADGSLYSQDRFNLQTTLEEYISSCIAKSEKWEKDWLCSFTSTISSFSFKSIINSKIQTASSIIESEFNNSLVSIKQITSEKTNWVQLFKWYNTLEVLTDSNSIILRTELISVINSCVAYSSKRLSFALVNENQQLLLQLCKAYFQLEQVLEKLSLVNSNPIVKLQEQARKVQLKYLVTLEESAESLASANVVQFTPIFEKCICTFAVFGTQNSVIETRFNRMCNKVVKCMQDLGDSFTSALAALNPSEIASQLSKIKYFMPLYSVKINKTKKTIAEVTELKGVLESEAHSLESCISKIKAEARKITLSIKQFTKDNSVPNIIKLCYFGKEVFALFLWEELKQPLTECTQIVKTESKKWYRSQANTAKKLLQEESVDFDTQFSVLRKVRPICSFIEEEDIVDEINNMVSIKITQSLDKSSNSIQEYAKTLVEHQAVKLKHPELTNVVYDAISSSLVEFQKQHTNDELKDLSEELETLGRFGKEIIAEYKTFEAIKIQQLYAITKSFTIDDVIAGLETNDDKGLIYLPRHGNMWYPNLK